MCAVEQPAPAAASRPVVDVVIPTVGRSSCRRAVESALRQRVAVVVHVVVDGPVELAPRDLPEDPRVVVHVLGERRGGNAARMAGVRAGTAPYVAFLDDDDEWVEEKLEAQLGCAAVMQSRGVTDVVISCRVFHGGRNGPRVPRRLLTEGQDVADYLFVRRSLWSMDTDLRSSALLVNRGLLESMPWNETLPRHQDWDWLIRVSRAGAAAFEILPQPLVISHRQPKGTGVSGGAGWQDSLTIAETWLGVITRREFGDFLLTVSAPIALVHKDWRGAARIVGRALTKGRPGPFAAAFLIAVAIFPTSVRSRCERLLTWFSSERRR